MIVNFDLIYAGHNTIDQRDKTTGNLTGKKWYVYHFLEVDKKENIVRSLDTFRNEECIVPDGIELLKPCVVTIELSATSNRKELVEIKLKK